MGLHNENTIHGCGDDSGKFVSNELSETWLKLLGQHEAVAQANTAMASGAQGDDPWFELLHTQGARVVDLQHVRLSDIQVFLTEQEVEQALQILHEQPASSKDQH